MSTQRLPTFFIPHGGGPCFFMDPMPGFPPDCWDEMAAYLRRIPELVGVKPRAILVISAHWETAEPMLLNAEKYRLLYDYYGFPPHTYQLTYPAVGEAALAARTQSLLTQAGFLAGVETERGLDHGVFIPFKLIYPQADIPIVQLSLCSDLDPAKHLAIGHALAPLRDEGVLIIGSGLSYHNLREFFADSPASNQSASEFDDWLQRTVTAPPSEREQQLSAWQQAPGARACHPRSEHLLPLMVIAGAAETDAGKLNYHQSIFGKMVQGVQFGATVDAH
jgi:aromatic ring-opening dioxygenase catalytic subunit (LigB family)